MLQRRMAAQCAASSADWTTRRVKRDTGVFFCFVFFHVEENEELLKTHRTESVAPLRVLHQ